MRQIVVKNSSSKTVLLHFSPMPPKKSGIADYSFEFIRSLSSDYKSIVFSDDPFVSVPEGVLCADLAQAHRFDNKNAVSIYQIGNNWDHAEIYRRAISKPGIVVLHDAKLLYLAQSRDLKAQGIARLLVESNAPMAKARAAEIAFQSNFLKSDYLVFDAARDLLMRALAIVVHSAFAKNMISRHYGPQIASKVHFTPHFAFGVKSEGRAASRRRLSLGPDDFVIVTSGFATRAKRYDWLIQALDRVAISRKKVVWVQAGPVRPDEYDLEALLDRWPRVKAISRLAGYVSEGDLNAYIAASDVLVNLRFPSVGESSGILSRALPLGACCIVSDTAAYKEYPDDVVLKVSVSAPIQSLYQTIINLIDEPAVRQIYSNNSESYASRVLTIARYRDLFKGLIDNFDVGMRGFAAEGMDQKDTLIDIGRIRPREMARGSYALVPRGSRVGAEIGPLSGGEIAGLTMVQLVPAGFIVESASLLNRADGAGGEEMFLKVVGLKS